MKFIIHLEMWTFFIFGALAGLGMLNLYQCQQKEVSAFTEILVQMPVKDLSRIDI